MAGGGLGNEREGRKSGGRIRGESKRQRRLRQETEEEEEEEEGDEEEEEEEGEEGRFERKLAGETTEATGGGGESV